MSFQPKPNLLSARARADKVSSLRTLIIGAAVVIVIFAGLIVWTWLD